MSWKNWLVQVAASSPEVLLRTPLETSPSASPLPLVAPVPRHEEEVEAVASAVNSSIKVGVLLDGDADLLTRAYTSKGAQGGRSAAIALKSRVESYIRKEKNVAKEVSIEVTAHSFMNARGLSTFIGDDMQAFAQGFSSSGFAFSMTDVGNESQAADKAFKGHLPFLLSTCDFVLVGGSHDNGYHHDLARFIAAGFKNKIILLRTHSYCASKIQELGFDEISFHLLFEERDPTARSRGSFGRNEGGAGLSGNGNGDARIDDFTSFPVASSVIPAAVVASSPTSQSEYEPLLRLLRSHASSGNPKARTLRGTIADEIKSLPNPPIQVGVGKSFRKYVSLAESKSLVKLGRGDIEGQDWMELVVADVITSEGSLPTATANPRIQPSTSTNIVVSAQSATSSVHSDFGVLIDALRSVPTERSTFSAIAGQIGARGSRCWGDGRGSFAAYVKRAAEAGVVEIGSLQGQSSDFWIKLTLDRRTNSAFLPSGSSPVDHSFPAKFVPLDDAFVGEGVTGMAWYALADRIAAQKGIVPWQAGSFEAYLREAEEQKLVKLSCIGNRKEWATVLRV